MIHNVRQRNYALKNRMLSTGRTKVVPSPILDLADVIILNMKASFGRVNVGILLAPLVYMAENFGSLKEGWKLQSRLIIYAFRECKPWLNSYQII